MRASLLTAWLITMLIVRLVAQLAALLIVRHEVLIALLAALTASSRVIFHVVIICHFMFWEAKFGEYVIANYLL